MPDSVRADLPRLRTDVPAADFLPMPPPVPIFDGDFVEFRLRTVDPNTDVSADAALVSEWMRSPHLTETWDQPWTAERWAADWRMKLETTYAVPLILSHRGEDVGYMEVYRPHRDEIGKVYRSEPHDLGIHIAVGNPALIGRGIVGPLLGAIPRTLFAADPECQIIVGEPDYRNARVHAVMRREGWTDCGEYQQRADRRVRLFLWPQEDRRVNDRLVH